MPNSRAHQAYSLKNRNLNSNDLNAIILFESYLGSMWWENLILFGKSEVVQGHLGTEFEYLVCSTPDYFVYCYQQL